MTRALITGATGFAGRHLAAACRKAGDEVHGLSRRRPDGDAAYGAAPDVSHVADLRDSAAVADVVADVRPDVVYHLAAQAHVGRSWQDPAGTLHDNVALALSVFDAVRAHAPGAAVVAVASGELYGPPERLPVDESARLRPQNPYAVSKAAADLLAGFYADAHGLRVVRARPFNHSGPGQDPAYAIASFARQVAAGAGSGTESVRVVTGNPETSRDYTDVRDVVRAYRLLAAAGRPGEAYNVCSGRAASARELVAALGRVAGVEVDHRVDPGLVRAHEVMEIRGSAEKLHAATGWAPQIPLERTLADTVEWWRGELRTGRAH